MPGRRTIAAACVLVVVVVVVGIVSIAAGGSSKDGTSAPRPTATARVDSVHALAPVSRPDLRPPKIQIRKSLPGQAPGLIFIAPKTVFGVKLVPGAQQGLEMIDKSGAVRYFKPNTPHNVAEDFEVQEYEGKPVLTYWYGRLVNGTGHGYGVIMDEHYRRIATVRTGDGLQADFHEFRLTPQGTALMLAYHDTTSNGKPVTEGVMQEIDIKTGKIVTDWHSLQDVPVSASYEPQGTRSASHFEYFHINAADLDTDGNILVSARHTWAIYKIQRHTGKLLWTLGGKLSDFKLSPGTQTAWQHDIRSIGKNEISVFDNGSGDTGAPKLRNYSRIAEIKIDPENKTAKLVKTYRHPDGVSGGTQGNGETLPDGHMFVGWGSAGIFSEFSSGGKLLFDARVPKGNDTYRAFKFPWKGVPLDKPVASVTRRGSRLAVHVSWNGSTEVKSWRALTGSSKTHLKSAGRAAWKDLDTGFSVPASASTRYVAVEALSSSGKVLSTSAVHTLSR